MTVVKGAAVDRFLQRPDRLLVLIYGPDAGLVTERGAALAKAFVGADGDVLRLEAKALADDPGRLADEAGAISLFGGRRAIRVSVSGLVPGVDALIETPPGGTLVVLEYEGSPKPTDALRKRMEATPNAAVIACYRDRPSDIADVLDAELQAADLTIAPDARAHLLQILGGDRGTTREEIRKLCLYALGGGEIGLDDVRAVVDDSGVGALNGLCDLVAEGETAAADRQLQRLRDEGMDAGAIALVLMRHLSLVQKIAAEREAGTPVDVSIRQLRPPVYGDRAEGLKRQARLWSADTAARAARHLNAQSLAIRRHGGNADALIGLNILQIASVPAARRAASH